ncbi:Poly-beta-hydroxybutyrate polymerase N terminal [Enhydrobacter aerosaccus]|jgi:polyhydroxyalkanoate synthase subunit PhaC|uniref:Poly-beta-hydroxybutyrate polymerase N terminal n=1 Tax=Enhydrobacter aerosaccus TaxID=225324 RepID=A0A1T4JLQ6_9HYPH|nr:Poly-beta-hydroxybutyrate polymerase N terminal [Enhydrobacter aerosaccus]
MRQHPVQWFKAGQCLCPGDESVGIKAFRPVDRMHKALTGQATGGISLVALALAYFDWSIHLASAPGKQAERA